MAVGRCGLVLVALGAAACGGEGEQDGRGPGATFVGEIEATDARVAVVDQGEEARAYVCGGPRTFTTHSRWFALTVVEADAGRREVRGEAEGWRLLGEIQGGEASGGLVSPEGEVTPWRARASEGALGGLYETIDEGCRAGLIIDATGPGEPVAQGTWCSKQRDLKAQVTPVRPLWLLASGLLAEARPGGEERRLWLAPVRPRRAP